MFANAVSTTLRHQQSPHNMTHQLPYSPCHRFCIIGGISHRAVRNETFREYTILHKSWKLIVKERRQVARASLARGQPQAAETGCILECEYYKAKAWKTEKELDRYLTPRSKKMKLTCEKSGTRDELRSKVWVRIAYEVIMMRQLAAVFYSSWMLTYYEYGR